METATRRDIQKGEWMKALPNLGKKRLLRELPFVLASLVAGRKAVLRFLLRLLRVLESSIDYLALWDASDGLHPKHRLTDYHDFFARRISSGQTVLDIGCGCGAVAADIVRLTGARVIGVDKDLANISRARELCANTGAEFMCADALTAELPQADVIVLSNLLEHLSGRDTFLLALRERIPPKLLLVRVPQYERHWMVPYAKELGVDTRLDPTHRIEHRHEEILSELAASGWSVRFIEARWGEYRIEAVPAEQR
jgi:2-polyprenyl-3-methyl-5-hydroxy-6-metoxy-1,4-benzoquinol methylase